METIAKLPSKKYWCAVWYDDKKQMHIIKNSMCKSKSRARIIADDYMLEHEVPTDITECLC
ncbi:hypothetical protein [Mammaliicoccus vitulinus]|uniref:hypothetical protein n=1 Tax=Mammaliicoccus vitulinus TaxID=71237 RepID=UPI00248B6126|nr:hypothetical protein [Mammaliicoccus vitulinus]